MAGKKKGMGGFNVPIVVFRTPEQHRAIIQPKRVSPTPPSVPKPKAPKSRKKRMRWDKCPDGTSSVSARVYMLGMRVYTEYLASAHWADVRMRWKASNMFRGWVCSSYGCDSKEGLSLHHWTYVRLGREQLSDLILVCRDCHKRIHQLERRGMSLAEATKMVTKHLPIAA
jgi:hypothetical protein